MLKFTLLITVVLDDVGTVLGCGASNQCQTFAEIYTNGEQLCNTMYGDAFVYTEDEANAYTMWFEGRENPNLATAANIAHLDHVATSDQNQCYLEYFHNVGEPLTDQTFGECRPWSDSACCAADTVRSATHIRDSYGPEYKWDRCGPLSASCERYMLQENCFYECDPTIGHYRRFPPAANVSATNVDRTVYNATNDDHNRWEVTGVPIKASYCNDWYAACAEDLFCATDGGNVFSCAAQYEPCDNEAILNEQIANLTAELNNAPAPSASTSPPQSAANADDDDDDNAGLVVGLVIAATVGVLGLGLAAVLITREKDGKPLFMPLDNTEIVGHSFEMSSGSTRSANL